MKTFEQARQSILKHHIPEKEIKVRVADALGRVMSRNLRAAVALPGWDNSAMDGFVVRAKDIQKASSSNVMSIMIRGVARAGDKPKQLHPNTAMRIMTGAVIPQGGDTVIAKEDVRVEAGRLFIYEPQPLGKHVRKGGEDVRQGSVLKLKNTPVSVGTLAYLASVGISHVEVYASPRVAVIVTGSELMPPGTKLQPGQIYESNSVMLVGALKCMGLSPVLVKTVPDQPGLLRKAIQTALNKSDFVLISGGVSVGDYDFSKAVLGELGVKTIFWKVAQKPGKPVYFGRKGCQSVFGIPGNPASAFVCFYEYIYPAIQKVSGWKTPFLPRVMGVVKQPIRRDSSKILFLKGKIQKGQVEVLRGQGSHQVAPLHQANCFIVIPPGQGNVAEGETVAVDLLPFGEQAL